MHEFFLRYDDDTIKLLTTLSGCLSADREKSATHRKKEARDPLYCNCGMPFGPELTADGLNAECGINTIFCIHVDP